MTLSQFSAESGLSYSAPNAVAAQAIERVEAAYLGSRAEVADLLRDPALSDGDVPMATVVSAYLNLMWATPEASQRARQLRPRLREQIRADANARERHHAAAVEDWCDGRLDLAAKRLDTLLGDNPQDVFSLKIAQYLHLYSGGADSMRRSVELVLGELDEQAPYFGYAQGIASFAYEEAGDYERAEPLGRAAMTHDTADAWAAHAVAHVFEMQGRCDEGVAWLEGLGNAWGETNNFRYHLDWHQALYHLELGAPQRALELYDRRVREDLDGDFYLDQCNAVALLMRLELHDYPIADRWNELAGLAERHVDDTELVFCSLHHLLALVRGDRCRQARALLATLERWPVGQQGEVAAAAGVGIGRALVAYGAGDFTAAVEHFGAAAPELRRIGGSFAQRDLFQMLRIDAQIRAGRALEARSLLAERAGQTPPTSWCRRRLAACEATLG